MNRLLSCASALALFLVFSIFGCGGGSGGGGDPGKLYLTDITIDENNVVTATVDLPENHYGFLFLNDGIVALEVVIQDGEIDLGVFEPGDYTLCLELFVSPSGLELLDNASRSGFFVFKDLTGVTECCDFTVDPLIIIEDDPPPDDPPPTDPPEGPKPRIKCRVNYDGAVTVIVKLNGYGPVILSRIGGDLYEVCETNNEHFTFDLDCGDYGFVLLDPDTEEELARCVLSIPCPDPDGDGDDDDGYDDHPDCPPRPDNPKKRFFICHNGVQLLVPWKAAVRHIVLHGDTWGRCDDDDDDDDDDD